MKFLSDLNHSEIERILEIVDRLNDVELRIEVGDMKLHVRKFRDAACATTSAFLAPPVAPQPARATHPDPAAGQAPAPAASEPAPVPHAASEPDLLEVRAPMLGRFYRASSPSEPVYVEVGSRVRAEDTVCMIEVMKLFNTVPAGVNGTIVEVVVENGQMVEHDAVLFRVRPE